MTKPKHQSVRSRNEKFAEKITTRIWSEQASKDNPYIAASALCHGYDLLDLVDQCSFLQVLYLLYRGELPNSDQEKLLESLMVALINPGPRHEATRAAMNAGVGKTLPVHILPIATSVLGGDYLGGGEVEPSMRFLRKHLKKDPVTIAAQFIETNRIKDESIAPGFGRRYGGIDIMTCSLAHKLCQLSAASDALHWGAVFSAELKTQGMGWLPTGLAAAVFADLGFQPKYGGPLFQLMGAPGLIAHGMELANKPFTAMPFIPDENYVIEDQN